MNIDTKIGVRKKKVSKNKDGRRETKRFLGPRVTPSMNKKFKFLLIDDYTPIIGILCRSTLDLHSFIVLVLGQMNELFKMAFKRLRQLFELFDDQKLSTHLKMPVYPHIRALKMGNKLAASLM